MATPRICHKWGTKCHLHFKISILEYGERRKYSFEVMNIVQTSFVAPIKISEDLSTQGSCR